MTPIRETPCHHIHTYTLGRLSHLADIIDAVSPARASARGASSVGTFPVAWPCCCAVSVLSARCALRFPGFPTPFALRSRPARSGPCPSKDRISPSTRFSVSVPACGASRLGLLAPRLPWPRPSPACRARALPRRGPLAAPRVVASRRHPPSFMPCRFRCVLMRPVSRCHVACHAAMPCPAYSVTRRLGCAALRRRWCSSRD